MCILIMMHYMVYFGSHVSKRSFLLMAVLDSICKPLKVTAYHRSNFRDTNQWASTVLKKCHFILRVDNWNYGQKVHKKAQISLLNGIKFVFTGISFTCWTEHKISYDWEMTVYLLKWPQCSSHTGLWEEQTNQYDNNLLLFASPLILCSF